MDNFLKMKSSANQIFSAFTWNEANIIQENIRNQDKTGLLVRLAHLLQNTKDPQLRYILDILIKKINGLLESDITQLRDAACKFCLTSPSYFSASVDPDS